MEAVETCDIVAIDEIGPMELFSRKFREAVIMSLQSPKLVSGVVHWRITDRLVVSIKDRKDCEIFVVTHENREELVGLMISRAVEYLEQH
jgi:nucleoside-triphosphatase